MGFLSKRGSEVKKVTMMIYVSAALSVAALPSSFYVPKFENQSLTAPQKKNRRGKFKRSGR